MALLILIGTYHPTRTSRNWRLSIEDWRFVVSLRSVFLNYIDSISKIFNLAMASIMRKHDEI